MENKINQEIEKKLKELQDQKYQKFQQKLCPKTSNILGVRVPQLRDYAKELLKKYEYKDLIESIENNYYEKIMLKGMIIGSNKKLEFSQISKDIENFVPQIDNWAVCDTFCTGLKIVKKYPEEMWEFLQKYLKSKKEYEARFGVVILLDYYITEKYIDEILKILDKISVPKYYTQMAVAWAISICIIRFYDKTVEYLKKCNLDEFTFEKSIQKAIESYRLTDDLKQFLKELKNVRAKKA